MHQETWFAQFLQMDMPHLGVLVALVSIVGAILMIVLVVASVQWRKVRIADIEATLKMQMLEQGMSAADIQAVLDAGRRKRKGWRELHREFGREGRRVGCN
jgi:hypothetical protein